MALSLHRLDYTEGKLRRRKPRSGAPSVARIVRLSAPAAALDEPYDILTGRLTESHPNTFVEGLFVNDSFADEVDAFVEAQRQREREEAAHEAGE